MKTVNDDIKTLEINLYLFCVNFAFVLEILANKTIKQIYLCSTNIEKIFHKAWKLFCNKTPDIISRRDGDQYFYSSYGYVVFIGQS